MNEPISQKSIFSHTYPSPQVQFVYNFFHSGLQFLNISKIQMPLFHNLIDIKYSSIFHIIVIQSQVLKQKYRILVKDIISIKSDTLDFVYNQKMNISGNTFGIFDPQTNMFYSIPVHSEEELNQFMTLLVEMSAQPATYQNNPMAQENFSDFDKVVEEVMNTPFNKFSQELQQFDF